MNLNYSKGYRLFELDMSMTSDNDLVLLHDWGKSLKLYFDSSVLTGRMTRAEFMAARTRSGWRQLDLDGLEHWMEQYPDALIVTDIKDDNIKGLTMISERLPGLTNRFLPQIYSPEEYEAVRTLGFEHIIFTLYRCSLPNRDILAFAEKAPLYGLTMPVPRALKQDFAQVLSHQGQRVFVHTVNSAEKMRSLEKKGVFGFYTDHVAPASQP
ncbi:MAG: hypothetical protein JEZ02_08295 [Desulfatibacillum sp.]|nr:hypothetical protein [Desulfatibacillum sp.]